jgi:hypothetical protein
MRFAGMSLSLSFRQDFGSQIALPHQGEKTMHIHGNSMTGNAANLYSAAQAERAAATERAVEVRKKLLKRASAEIEGAATPEETFMVGLWLDSVESEDGYHASAGRDPDLG